LQKWRINVKNFSWDMLCIWTGLSCVACKDPFPWVCLWHHKQKCYWIEPFSMSMPAVLQCVWVANPRFLVQLQVWNGVWRGSCPSCLNAQASKKKKRKHKFWIHLLLNSRQEQGIFSTVFNDLRNDKSKFSVISECHSAPWTNFSCISEMIFLDQTQTWYVFL